MNVMALDLARKSGWAVGKPGAIPAHGSVEFASSGSSHEAVFAKASQWISGMIADHSPDLIVWEAPMVTSFNRGNTNANTTSLLYGLPAVIGAVAYALGVYDCRKANTKDVRNHFIGSNPKRAKAKAITIQKCRSLGLAVGDDNEADAVATWFFMCALINPATSFRGSPLFGHVVNNGG